MKKNLLVVISFLITQASFGALSRFECKAEHENKYRDYTLALNIVLTESNKAIVEYEDSGLKHADPQAFYGALTRRAFLFGDRSNLSLQFSAKEDPSRLKVGETFEPWVTYRNAVNSGGFVFQVTDEFKAKCTRVAI
jgi:hypothetical protein